MKQNPKNSLTTKDLCFIALFMALVCVSTLFFKIPIPLGYAHLGNGFIFLASVFLGNPGGLLCAGVGSALADFFGGYQIWILPTLTIKSIMGFAVSAIARPKKSPDATLEKTRVAFFFVSGLVSRDFFGRAMADTANPIILLVMNVGRIHI